MSGYRNRPEETAAALRDGWLYTGDIGAIDDDGYLFVLDRKKDMAIVGGFNVYPREVEEALCAHPAVAEAAVIAIPDEKWQERPLAAVVLKDGASATAEELREFLAPQFAKWWLPDRIEFVEEIPKTAVGKFRKTALREQFAQQPAVTTT